MKKTEIEQRADGWWYRLCLGPWVVCDWQFGGSTCEDAEASILSRFGVSWLF